MPQAVITVERKAPRPDKKQGHLFDTGGGRWNVYNDKLANFREGVTYEINYEENEFSGTKFNLIKNAEPTNKAATVTASSQGSTSPSDKDREIFVCALLKEALGNPNVDPFTLDRAKVGEFGRMCSDLYTYLFKQKAAAPKPAAPSPPPPEPEEQKGEMNDEIPF